MQDAIEKKWDLDNIYQLAHEAHKAGDIDQALKLSQKGLKLAESQLDEVWKPKFEQLNRKITVIQPETAVIVKHKSDLTRVKGIGHIQAQKLREAGYNSVEQITNLTPQELATINGIGLASAEKIITSAQSYGGESIEKTPTLKKMLTSQQNIIQLTHSEKEIKPDNNVSENDSLESCEGHTALEGNSIIEQNEIESEKEIKTSLSKTLGFDGEEKVELGEPFQKEDQFIKSFPKSENLSTFRKSVAEQASKCGFQILSEEWIHSDLPQADFLIVKEIMTTYRKLLILCPLKLCEIENPIIVSEESNYTSSNTDEDLLLINYKDQLVHAAHRLFTLFQENKTFIEILNTSLSLKKEYFLTLKDNSSQTRVYIIPLFITQGPVEFIETSIPFAYQKNSKLYFLNKSQFSKMLTYLEKKFYALEEYHPSQLAEKHKNHVYAHLQHNIPFYSIPILGFGILLFVIAFSHVGILLQFFIGLSYAVLGVYGGLLGYLAYIFFHQRDQERQQFIIHSTNPISTDNTSLELMAQELSDQQILQLGYEWYGKEVTHPYLVKINKKQAEQSVVDNIKKEPDYDELFEQEGSNEENSNSKEEYIHRFSNFLDD